MPSKRTRKSVVVSTGLVALDAVLVDAGSRPDVVAAGGTAGNVSAALAYLGWQSYPVARLADDHAGRQVRADLSSCGVRDDFLSVGPVAATPIVIERLTTEGEGAPKHRFYWNCPCCGNWLPRYKPVTVPGVKSIGPRLPASDVFFFDRASPGALELARHYRDMGALVVFECAAVGRPEHLGRAVQLAHVVKYSNERMDQLPLGDGKPLLEVQTLAEDGLRYRTRLGRATGRAWRSVAAYHVPKAVDTAGCGDWCTAGLLAKLASGGLAGFRRMGADEVLEGMKFGQALAAWNCAFVGARGGMTEQSRQVMSKAVAGILGGGVRKLGATRASAEDGTDWSLVCPACPDDPAVAAG